MWSKRRETYCAFCRTPRAVYIRRHANSFDFFVAVLAGVMVWQVIGSSGALWAGVVSGAVLVVCEFSVHMKWRLSLRCKHCGFDPLIYKRSPEKAAELVRLQLQKRSQSTEAVLARPLFLPKRRLRKAFAPWAPGGAVSVLDNSASGGPSSRLPDEKSSRHPHLQ